jgi:hypothetical protein
MSSGGWAVAGAAVGSIFWLTRSATLAIKDSSLHPRIFGFELRDFRVDAVHCILDLFIERTVKLGGFFFSALSLFHGAREAVLYVTERYL